MGLVIDLLGLLFCSLFRVGHDPKVNENEESFIPFDDLDNSKDPFLNGENDEGPDW